MAVHPIASVLRECPMVNMIESRPLSYALLGLLTVVSIQGCKQSGTVSMTPTDSSPSDYLEDSVLKARVRVALGLSPLQRSEISIQVHNGVVLLSGMVTDKTQRDLAVLVAQNVQGVEKVDDFTFSARLPSTIPRAQLATRFDMTLPGSEHAGQQPVEWRGFQSDLRGIHRVP